MNQDILTVIEADALFGELPTGLAGWEEVNLSACLVNYALECGEKGPFDSIRSEARKKYTTPTERTRIVLRALDILLQDFRLEKIAGGKQIVTKTKATLSLVSIPPRPDERKKTSVSEFITLSFGDLWCVVFAPDGQVRGICSISTSKAVADEVVVGIVAG